MPGPRGRGLPDRPQRRDRLQHLGRPAGATGRLPGDHRPAEISGSIGLCFAKPLSHIRWHYIRQRCAAK
jgi:hypothetical protein